MNHTLLKLEKRNALRPGLTLLEVLISTFVLSIGLLGLLSLIPVGGYRVGQVNQFDRAATTGRHAFREFKTRGMLEPNRWMWWNDGTGDYVRTWRIPENSAGLTPTFENVDDWAETFCIDPLYIARAAAAGTPSTTWPGRTFPYDLMNGASYQLGLTGSSDIDDAPRMPRVTLSMLEDSSQNDPVEPTLPLRPFSMVSSVAERVFMSQNDGIYDLPNDEAETPIRLYSGGDADIAQFEGDYTWMAMVSRSPQEVLPIDVGMGNYDDISPSIRNEYKVSIIVFAQRNFDVDIVSAGTTPADELPSERICGLQFLNGLGLGGGDVLISAGDASAMSSGEAEDYLDVAPNQWIMVCSWVARPTNPAPSTTIYPNVYGQNRLARPIYRWYRVVATDKAPEIQNIDGTPMWVRYLTLDGPDWDPQELNSSGTGLTGTYAVLVDGVVAVFERTIRREE